MVVWRFWQQSCCHSIPSTAMARNSCCVMWPSLPLHASFLIFWPGRLNLRPTGHDLWSPRSLSRILHHLLNKAPALCVAWHCLLWQRTLLPTFLTVDCIIWAVVILPTYFSQSYGWCLGILRWIRSCAVLRNYSILPTLTKGFIPWSTQCLLYFLKICCFSEQSLTIQTSG